jgi:hypothetical protein
VNPSTLRHFVWIAFLFATGAARAQPATVAEHYSPPPASAGGMGKRCTGREISAMMGWQSSAWLKREERTDLPLAALSLKPGTKMSDARCTDQTRGRRVRAEMATHRGHPAPATRSDVPEA